MQRSKIRKVVTSLPVGLPEEHIRKALDHVHNARTRARVESRIRRRDGAQGVRR